MDPELLINRPESYEDPCNDLFETGYPPSTAQQSDHSQASEWSRLSSAVSIPHTSGHFHSRKCLQLQTDPRPPSPVRDNNRGRNGHSQHQSSHHRQHASFTATGYSPWRTRHASRQNLRSETELDITKWTVIQVQRFLKEHGILFHQNYNKTRLFHLYKAFSSTQATTKRPSALPA
ncbi:30S ribosomal protein S14 [Dissostichus eleginoides]|uniref:30S ribosomal protein S14 n=1 Tax=Dissostichus eleginoides TaxID=100907 RepID=A0AAD9C0E3_DISEL|nr:30S ribosomal protein S14 [Dissostichus eleginoides]